LVADVSEGELHPISNFLMHFVRDANAAGLSDGLQPGCDIDAVPVEALTFVDDISNVYADPEEHRRPGVRVQFRHAALDFGGALHCADSARELGENAVPSDIDHASAKPRYQRNNRLPNFSNLSDSPLFISAHESAVPRNVGRQDGG
jgi:hypothetical protein